MRTARQLSRPGRQPLEPVLLLALLVFLSLVFVRTFFRDSRPFGQQVLSAFFAAAQCFGVFVGLLVLLASAEMLKQAAARSRARRLAQHLAWLAPWRADGRLPATEADVSRMRGLLADGDENVRRHALDALFAVLRAAPPLAATPRLKAAIMAALAREPGFAQLLITRPGEPPLHSVTLGAKLGAGTAEKLLAPPTGDPAELARWVNAHRDPEQVEEVQVSVGFDTGTLPGLEGRARFIGLWLFLATTELHRFQALDRRPRRDPNAAYGLIIRGDLVEVRCPGQARGHRLDYVFPLPAEDEAALAALFATIQRLNLGLLAACTEDACRVYSPGEPPAWLSQCREAAAAYRRFERRLVALLRRFDAHRDPGAIHPTEPCDDAERRRAVRMFRLEECLYPYHRWIVPLYDPDTSWERLLMPLRAVEGMLLHQGEGASGLTRGAELIAEARKLVEEDGGGPTPPDPFLDVGFEEASRDYLLRVRRAMGRGEMTLEHLPDPAVFLRAEAYYAPAITTESEP